MPRGEALVSCRRRLWGARDSLADARAAAGRDLRARIRSRFDFHKWGQVPYDAGFLIVRDGEQHRDAFAAPAAYLRRETRGLAAGSVLALRSRPRSVARFQRAQDLVHPENLRHRKARRGDHANLRAGRISGSADSGRAAAGAAGAGPAQHRLLSLSRCRRQQGQGDIVIDIQESGIAAPSTTLLDGQLAIRAAIVNHRTDTCDLDALLAAVIRFGTARTGSSRFPTVPNRCKRRSRRLLPDSHCFVAFEGPMRRISRQDDSFGAGSRSVLGSGVTRDAANSIARRVSARR